MTPQELLGDAARRLLADGRWHDRSEVIARLARRVPPGYASRVAARAREADARWRQAALGRVDAAPRHGSDDPAAAVLRGQRITATRVLAAKWVESRQLADGSRQVRLVRS